MTSEEAASESPAIIVEDAMATVETSVFDAVEIEMDARLGTLTFTIKELMDLKSGSVVTLDRKLGDQVDLVLKGKVVARGEIVAVDDNFAIKITEIADLK